MSRSVVPRRAGVSSDTLEQGPPVLTHMDQDDNEHEQWSDAHDTLETDDERDVIEEVSEPQGDLTIRPPKGATTSDHLKTHEMHTPSPTASSPPAPQDLTSQDDETGSAHSLPMVQITEPSSPVPFSSRSISEAHSIPSTTASLAPTTNSSLDRRSTLRAQDVSTPMPVEGRLLTLTETPYRPVHQTVFQVSSQTSSTAETILLLLQCANL